MQDGRAALAPRRDAGVQQAGPTNPYASHGSPLQVSIPSSAGAGGNIARGRATSPDSVGSPVHAAVALGTLDSQVLLLREENSKLKEEIIALQARVNVLNSPLYQNTGTGVVLRTSHIPQPRCGSWHARRRRSARGLPEISCPLSHPAPHARRAASCRLVRWWRSRRMSSRRCAPSLACLTRWV